MRRCPICGAAALAAYRPFCSKRCADVDLGHWLGGAYRIAVNDDDAEPLDVADDADGEGRDASAQGS